MASIVTPPDLDERINAIIRRHQFEPIHDPEKFKQQVEAEVRVEVRKALASGELKPRPGHQVKIEVRIGPPELGPPITLEIPLDLPKSEP
jgi:hypothetical protein